MRRANQISSLALILAAGLAASSASAASTTTITASDANVLNLLSPFLTLNATTIGVSTLTANLNGTISTNSAAAQSPVIEAVSISDKAIFSANSGSGLSSITLLNTIVPQYYGVAANLGGGLPTQAIQSTNGQNFSGSGNLTITTGVNGTIAPSQSYGGLGALGGAFQTAVSPYAVTASTGAYVTASTTGSANPLLTGQYQTQTVVNLLNSAYNSFNSIDLGVAKYYFANGTTNGTSTAVAPNGYTLPTYNGMPNTTNSVYDVAYGVNNNQNGQNQYGDSRPVQVAANNLNQYDPTSLYNLGGNPSFPSGHTTYAFTDSILIGMMTPQFFQSMILRASEYGNSRIDLGVHYPLDIIASRSFVQYNLVQLLSATAATGSTQASNPYYYTNTNGSTTVLNLNGQFVSAAQSLNGYLNTQASTCGGSVAACAASNPYNTYSATTYAYQATAAGVTGASTAAENAAIYAYRMTYGLPTYTYAQAPRELNDGQGNTAAILLSTLYGGKGNAQAQALANAATGGTSGGGSIANLATSTINQIIYDTEGQALQAFYGTQLSYWSRINLYAAAGFFSNGMAGALTFAAGDTVTTDVTVASGGSLGGAGTITGNLTFQSGSSLTATSGATLTVHGGAVNLQAGSSVALSGAFLPGAYQLITTDAGQSITRDRSVGVTGATTNYETASLQVVGDPVLTLTLTSNFAALAQTPNQRAVAAGIDAAANASALTGDAATFYKTFINAGDGASAFDALSGAGIAAANTAALRFGANFADTIGDQAYFGLSGNTADVDGVSHVPGYAQNPKTGQPIVTKGPLLAAPERDWRLWGVATGGGANTSASTYRGTPSSTATAFGGLMGLDYLLQRNWLAGVAVGGGESHFNTVGLATSGHTSSVNFGLYTAYQFEHGFYGELSQTFGFYDNHISRNAAIGGLTAESLAGAFSSFEERTRVEIGRKLSFDAFRITPFLAFEYATLNSAAFTETNSAGLTTLALAGKSYTTASAPLFVGFRVSGQAATLFGWNVTPDASFAWVHEFIPNRKFAGSLAVLPGSDFTVYGPRAASDAAQVKAGLVIAVSDQVSLFAKFVGELAPSANSYGGRGGFTYRF
ncbi:hypothetical protein CCR94_00965 [Rhodoblastus sphagnicola]|uniref:Uncharacterized protein n=1 Tax=Rhodoblastus sphagnicola TaxID=333368 RepID=A0A2S6NG79_9HYPH|nr:autotransporter domain-containing protein [Rhodoblastus sphagnicola]MBB4200886.1 uncharacterized protein with beta-barrel porin domain [Rhodoblastus sphagnicola]PPQ33655.1 hypothetical protein CCR94_00965 [Rhodoblastus sphagnicola]